jgi:hypothetical protein
LDLLCWSPKWLFPSSILGQNYVTLQFLKLLFRAHLFLCDFIIFVKLSEECKLWRSAWWRFVHSPCISSVLASNILNIPLYRLYKVSRVKCNSHNRLMMKHWNTRGDSSSLRHSESGHSSPEVGKNLLHSFTVWCCSTSMRQDMHAWSVLFLSSESCLLHNP